MKRWLALMFLLLFPFSAQAQSPQATRVVITAVDDQQFPLVTFQATPFTAGGGPLTGLGPSDFLLQEDDQSIPVFTAESFTDAAQPVSVLLLLDAGSAFFQGQGELKTAVSTLYTALEQTDESAFMAFSILADGTTVNLGDPFPQLNPQREMAFTRDEGALLNLLNGLQIGENDGSPLYDALLKAVRFASSQATHERRAIFLVSDGSDINRLGNGPGSQVASADTAIAEAQRLGVPVFAVGWGSSVDPTFLQVAATLSGGTYQQFSTAEQLNQFFAAVVEQLRQQYRFSYTSQLPPDDAQHTFALTVQGVSQTAPFQARYPLNPMVRQITAVLPGQQPMPLDQLTSVKGRVTLTPDILARGQITAVHYYLDNEQTATYSATSPPWSFPWNTANLAPDQPHHLFIELLDDATPPHVGTYETAVFIITCTLYCQLEQTLGFNPFYLLAGVGIVLVGAGLLFARRQPAQQTPVPRDIGKQLAPQIRPFPTPPRQAAPFAPQPSAKPALSRTEVLGDAPPVVAFLIDPQNGQEYQLGDRTIIGRKAESQIVLEDVGIADQHAQIFWDNTHFTLAVMTTTHQTRVNGTAVNRTKLSDNDRIEMGQRTLRYRQIG